VWRVWRAPLLATARPPAPSRRAVPEPRQSDALRFPRFRQPRAGEPHPHLPLANLLHISGVSSLRKSDHVLCRVPSRLWSRCPRPCTRSATAIASTVTNSAAAFVAPESRTSWRPSRAEIEITKLGLSIMGTCSTSCAGRSRWRRRLRLPDRPKSRSHLGSNYPTSVTTRPLAPILAHSVELTARTAATLG